LTKKIRGGDEYDRKLKSLRGDMNESLLYVLVSNLTTYIQSIHTSDFGVTSVTQHRNATLDAAKQACEALLAQPNYFSFVIQSVFPLYFRDVKDPATQNYFCATLFLLGLVSHVLKDMNMCTLLIKGGKAIQGVTMNSRAHYQSDDIDISVIPHLPNVKANSYARFVSHVIQTLIPPMTELDVSREKGSIIKLSVSIGEHRVAVADIGYDDISLLSPIIQDALANELLYSYQAAVPMGDAGTAQLLFTFPTESVLLDEYLYWLMKYHVENQFVKANALKSAAFIYKSERSINALLGLFPSKKGKRQIILAEHISSVVELLAAESVAITDMDMEEVAQMILKPKAREELFVSPTQERPVSTRPPSRSRTPLEIKDRASSVFSPREETPILVGDLPPLTVTAPKAVPATPPRQSVREDIPATPSPSRRKPGAPGSAFTTPERPSAK
jgi:hypothetical protein